MKRLVLQGHSICHGEIWYNQSEVIDCDASASFEAEVPIFDEKGKTGSKKVNPTEALPEPVKPVNKKEEG